MADAPALSRITTLAQLDDLMEGSSDRYVWLFKHSLICPTSERARNEFESFAARRCDLEEVAVIEIQRARELSKEVAVRTGVRHESPQILLIRDGEVLWHTSHWHVNETALEEAAATHVPAAVPVSH